MYLQVRKGLTQLQCALLGQEQTTEEKEENQHIHKSHFSLQN